MKHMLPILAVIGAIACTGPSPAAPRVLHTEEAFVEQVIFSPGHDCSGTGYTSEGTLTFSDCSTEDVYAVVFRCQHGKFVVKHGEKAMRAWQAVKQGDRVTVAYYGEPGEHLEFVSVVDQVDAGASR